MAGFTDQVPSLLASRYLVGAQIARGGMSVVYRAWDSVLNRDVAVKMLDLFVADPAARERFAAEGQTLSGLNHPGLTMVFDAGAHDDRPYLVMELVDGDTLTQHYRRWHLERGEVITIGIALAEALTYVHGCGIVHRDIKPSNVLIGRDGRVRLADFGIARLVGDAGVHTATGVTIGTAAYLSPEQVRGEPATGASDIYALGLVLLEALGGRPVFTGAPDVVALARLIGPPPIDEALPPLLRGLLAAMTSDRPADRPSAGQVAVRLREAAESAASAVATDAPIPVPQHRARAPEPAEPLPSAPTATGQSDTPATDPRPSGATVPDPLPDSSSSRRRLLGWSLGIAAGVILVPALVLESPLTGDGDRPAPSARSVPGSTGTPATAQPRPTSSVATTAAGSVARPAPVNTVVASPAPVTGAASTPVASSTTAGSGKAKGKSNGKGNGNKGSGNNGNGNGNGNGKGKDD